MGLFDKLGGGLIASAIKSEAMKAFLRKLSCLPRIRTLKDTFTTFPVRRQTLESPLAKSKKNTARARTSIV